jgi:hypothetical protein
MRRTLREPISRPAWQVLLSFGLVMLTMFGLMFFALWLNQEQFNRDVCDLSSIFVTGPQPQDGPTGERSRFVRRGVDLFRERRDCA